jgi:eukaryotic-like serine/threonine-protein kinase
MDLDTSKPANAAPPSTDEWLDRIRESLAPELEVTRCLGEGAMSRVLLAREAALKRLVAVKVLREELAQDDVARARFEREAQAAAGIRHPNVTAVFRVGRAGKLPYIVIEHIQGRTLADRLKSAGPVDPPEARRILASVGHALASAHERGIVHRDVRPRNVMVEEASRRVVLMDFGIAALLETGQEEVARLTAPGVRLGDPLHMSPEQLRGDPVTAASDVYCLGILGHELLTGAPPDRSAGGGLEERLAATDPELARMIGRCLQAAPEHRPTARDVAQALSRAPGSGTGASVQADPAEQPILQEFLREVKRRKVGRVAVAYVAVAFFFLQGMDLLLPALPVGNPDPWYQGIVALTLAGFPAALVLSWLYDLTSEGIRRAPKGEIAASPQGRGRKLALPMAALALSVLAAAAVWFFLLQG